MKRRLDIAMTLVGGPRVIFLDEPTTGLDPRSRHGMWQIVRELVAGGTTVFLTTQYLEEADQLADRIAVLHGGRIAAEGSAEELKRLVPGGHVRLRFTDPAAYRRAAAALRGTAPTTRPSPCRSPAAEASANCGPSSTGWTPPASRPTNSPCTPPTWTTCSSP